MNPPPRKLSIREKAEQPDGLTEYPKLLTPPPYRRKI